MKTTVRKTETKVKSKEKTLKDDASTLTKKPQDDKLKRSVYSVSTPRNYVQKSSTVDIYAQKKKSAVQATKAPKKVPGTTVKNSNVSPIKDQLKSSSSSVSQISQASVKKVKSSPQTKVQAKVPNSARSVSNATPRTGKDLPFLNVTINSPVAKKKLQNKDGGEETGKTKLGGEEARKSKDGRQRSSNEAGKDLKSSQTNEAESSNTDSKEVGHRQRTKTRTLDDNEVKVLTPDVVDNNAEMLNLSKKLAAKPKAFFIELDDSAKDKSRKAEKSSEDEIDYEDDFESYESDFESYHDSPSQSNSPTDHDTETQCSEDHDDEDDDNDGGGGGDGGEVNESNEGGTKEGRDEEKMLDSGNFDLRDSRSANKAKPVMADIQEDTELDVRSSLTDEGFQDMSSAGCSIRTVHMEVLERPLFIDFTKAKENKRKRKIFEKLKERAKDILSMVTLHEMSYALFEMKPIPYDVYMATFGRSNYIQTASQTFDDGVPEEIQTDEVLYEEKWTQHPVEFSAHDIYLKDSSYNRKYSVNTEDYLLKFTFLISKSSDVEIKNKIKIDESYRSNPLRMFFEQKDGAGPAEMLPYENYKNKLKNNDFNTGRLKKFLKKHESRISNILSSNIGSDRSDLSKSSKHPFSKGYLTISTSDITDEKLQFLKQLKVCDIIFSESKSNLVMTIHKKCDVLDNKCVICLWDMSIVRTDPLKILIAIDDIMIGRFLGNSDGMFVAALNDGSVHLWDLSEEPTWHSGVANAEKTTDLVEIEPKTMTQTELDREWNLKNSHVGFESVGPQCILQACSFTSSAAHVQQDLPADSVVGLEINARALGQDAGRKLLGQVCSLQRIGILTIWSIIQERKATDMGKAYWSKMKLEINQTISLIEHLDLPRSNSVEDIFVPSFNLNAAKRRTSVRKKEKNQRKQFSRQKSAVKNDSDRPSSVSSVRNEILSQNSWESGIICTDFKIMRLGNTDNYLVGKNCGEVLCCTRNSGLFKIKRFCVATDTAAVTTVEVSPHSLPYFLAATDSGTVNLCSVLEARVLLTLDCRNGPPTAETERYHVDSKGRYLGSARPHSACPSTRPEIGIAVTRVCWSRVNPCCMFALLSDGALLAWELTHSDLRARHCAERAAVACAAAGDALALLTLEGEVQVHRLWSQQQTAGYLDLFQKYIALL